MESNLVLRVQRSNVVVGSIGDLLVTVWHRAGSIDDVRAIHDEQRKFARPLGQIGALNVVHHEAAIRLPPEMRRLIDEQAEEAQTWTKASALVLMAHGLGASLIRGVIAGIMLLRRQETPLKVFEEVGGALTWIAPHVRVGGQAPAAQDLTRAYASLPGPSAG